MEYDIIPMDDIELFYRDLSDDHKRLVSTIIQSEHYLVCSIPKEGSQTGTYLGVSGSGSLLGPAITNVVNFCKIQFGEVWLKNLLRNLLSLME